MAASHADVSTGGSPIAGCFLLGNIPSFEMDDKGYPDFRKPSSIDASSFSFSVCPITSCVFFFKKLPFLDTMAYYLPLN